MKSMKGTRLGFLVLKQRRCPLSIAMAMEISKRSDLVLHEGEEKEGDNQDPLPGYCNGSNGELGCEYGQPGPRIPSGYGLESMDLYE
ncbi:hypothetical protein DKX38_005458 [Salix brachista]|uniref:Uncharacterized protein n=1 Tax=Salix brachista TaxID=2182728 RepID=A0A5N5N234_9ROSI|nr:hypothetical protein DKX38_005458 [Salix brachista]